jgi:hypothetical protein
MIVNDIEEYENWEDSIRHTFIEMASYMDKNSNNTVNMVWIGDSLSLLGILSIKTWQRFGFVPQVWSYSNIQNLPHGVISKNAEEIMPKESLFTFEGIPQEGLSNGGHGSYSHWSDIFQLKLLEKYGGWYSQLDVAVIKTPKLTDYFFANHAYPNIVNTFVMKVPIDAPFISGCISELKEKINKKTAKNIGWLDSMKIVGSHVRKNNLSNFISYNSIECGCHRLTHTDSLISDNVEFIHWCNALCGNIDKLISECHKNSIIYKLLKHENLI